MQTCIMDIHAHTVLHNDPLVAAQLRETRAALTSVHATHAPRAARAPRATHAARATPMLSGDGQRCVAITKAGKRCRNRATAFGDGTLCAVHLRQRLGQSEMADIRAYRAENAASGPGMDRDATGTWVVDESIRLEDGGSANDAIVL